MKKIVLLIIALVLISQTIKAQTVVLDTNGVTIKYTGTTVPSPYFIQANPRGTGNEWFAIVDNNTKRNITNYAQNIQSGIDYFTPSGSSTPIPYNNIVTTLVTDMAGMFDGATTFNQPIGSWDVSNVTDMSDMFAYATAFNQPIGFWNVSKVTDMSVMFIGATAFNQNIGSWDVNKVTDMSGMFYRATSFNPPLDSWDVSSVTGMAGMFYRATSFNQPIGSWNVSSVTNMYYMFYQATAFNQPIGSWNVSKVTDMNSMFWNAPAFNQPIGSWNVSSVTNMYYMFYQATDFNQPIGSWDVSSVTDMAGMFYQAPAFNQPIGSWNVSIVTNMNGMFYGATAFNQPIGSWNVSKVNTMEAMFRDSGLSTANYDALLIGWSTIISPETPLKSNIQFSGGYSTYCNGQSARNILINTYGWSITDSGPDFGCTTLGTEAFDISSLKLYPNPVLSVLNVDNNLTNQPYNIIDTLGKVILKGKLNEGNNSINVEQLSKGIYHLKVSDNKASKFIKE